MLCAVLIIMCAMLVFMSAAFSADKTVEVLGFNIYLVENDDIPTAPEGSAVLVKKCSSADLDEGKLVLYLKADAEDAPTLGYVKSLTARDGVQYATVTYKDTEYEFAGSKLVGRADYSSAFLGGAIGFIKTPIGVAVIALLPCAALILFDIIRAVLASRPEPEVIPKVKNADENRPHNDVKLSVDSEGKALYSKVHSSKRLPQDNGVLFNYTGVQKVQKNSPPKPQPPIIPLTDRKPQTRVPEITGRLFEITIPVDDTTDTEPPRADTESRAKVNAGAIREKTTEQAEVGEISIPERRPSPYIPNEPPQVKVLEKTAEIPIISKRTDSNAFFAQSSANDRTAALRVGKQRRTPRTDETAKAAERSAPKIEKGAGKRSAQILASKSLYDLFSDDE